MPFDLGATARLTATCKDPDGVLTTADAVTVTVTLPDGTTATPAASETSTGQYQADYVTTVAGRHTVRWVFTGPAAAYTDALDVRDAAAAGILSLADAKAHLNITASRDNDEIKFWLGASTRAVEYFVGPVTVRPVTEVHPVREARALVLLQVPAIELTAVNAVQVGGTGYDIQALTLDGSTGLVARADGGPLRGPLRIAYTAGRTTVPENITAAARVILQHLWRTQLAGRGGLAGGGDDFSVTEPIPGLGYAIPNRAVQLLEPDRLPPGVA
ncbi:hypothetical protein [Streptomyces odontomachi]|uniref:hypothetical protein n=1 Tax=Streptomyces odontomachi TaxID=2944940 RepID=UPI00210C4B25|nr:hypothetical protein [Streptomyces sp. ODS25]